MNSVKAAKYPLPPQQGQRTVPTKALGSAAHGQQQTTVGCVSQTLTSDFHIICISSFFFFFFPQPFKNVKTILCLQAVGYIWPAG